MSGIELAVPEIFIPTVQQKLMESDSAGRACVLRDLLHQGFDALPPIANELRNRDAAVDPATALRYADHLLELRLPLADRTTKACCWPYDWYCERGESSAEKSPALMPQRMAFLGSLVVAHRRTGDDRYVQAARDYIMDYVTRYWTAPGDIPAQENWLDVGIRIGQWWHMHLHGGLYTALREWFAHPAFSGDDLVLIFRAITHMTNALLTEMALGSNWRLHQLTGVFTQGCCYPFLKDAAVWLATGVNSLNEEFDVQFLADGSHEELSVGYGAGVWSAFVRFFAFSREAPHLGLHFDEQRMETIQEYYLSSKKPFGLSAGFGDVWAIRGDAELRRDAPPHTQMGEDVNPQSDRWATLRENVELMSRYTDFASSRFILTGTPVPSWTTRFHPSSGYMYLRNGWTPDSLYMNFHLGYYANCHCHYGILGIEVAGLGREFIVDPGNSDYSSRPINANFRNTRAHSTMTVDGLNQSAHSPAFVSRLTVGRQYDFAVGVYRGGYLHGSPFYSWDGGCSAAHYRHILFVKDSYWVVLDAFTAAAGHTAETRFQLMPTVVRSLPGGGYRTGYTASNLALIPLAWEGWEHGMHEGEEDPIEGWLPSPHRGFTAAPVYKAMRPTTGGPLWHGTLLFPYRDAEISRVEVKPADIGPIGFGWTIETDDWTDVLFISNSWMPRPYQIGPVTSDAPLCHLRFVKGRPVHGYTCEGNYLCVEEQEFFRAPGSLLAREFIFDGAMVVEVTQPRYKNR